MINKDIITIAVHNGTFHTDDVFAVAILSLVFASKKIEIIRTRDEEKILSADVVVDVGGIYDPLIYRFDHHQKEGAGVRENGVPYASAGLVWNTFGSMLCDGNEEMVKNIDTFLIQGIDGPDNGYNAYDDTADNNPRYYRYAVGDIVNTYRPVMGEDTSYDDAFVEAVTLAKKILERALIHTKEYFTGRKKLEDAYNARESDYYIITDTEHRAWYEFAGENPSLLYMLYPRITSGWSAKCAIKETGSFEPKKAFPESWRGLQNGELESVTGVPGSLFCHRTGYLVVADTKEHLLQLVKIAIES
jgi:uncharacterized UPF0160 family protein